MAALYLYGATHIVYLDKYKNATLLESLRPDEPRIVRQVQKFWKALLENRAVFFRPSVLEQLLQFSHRARPLQIRCILADCLLKIADLLERFRRSVMDMFGLYSIHSCYQ